MILRGIVVIISVTLTQVSFATNNNDALGLDGTYKCYGYDMHDGAYSNATAILTLDAKDSDFANNYGAYHFKLTEIDGAVYLGEVAASGNVAAIYFANTSPNKSTDLGIGIAAVTHDKDQKGNVTTVLHKFYYEPSYEGGGNGSETCTKIS